jgi:surfeit locus 1 family protein
VLLAAGLGLALLLSLGVWQLRRLAWKQDLIARYEAAMASDPMPLSVAIERSLAGESIAGLKVKAAGRFASREPLRLLAARPGGASWTLIHGFEQDQGMAVLVNRGAVADGAVVQPAPQGTVDITGYVVWHDRGRGLFDGDNDVAGNRWYWWDMAAMRSQFTLTGASPGDMVIDLAAGSPGTEGLSVDPPKANLRNNHLGYAITWFGLAAALAVMTVLFLRSQRQES